MGASPTGDIAILRDLRKAWSADGERADFVLTVTLRSSLELGFSVPFSASGQEVGRRTPSNAYRVQADAGQVPPMDVFRFGDLPPRVSRE